MKASLAFVCCTLLSVILVASVRAQQDPLEGIVVRLLASGGRKADLSLISAENHDAAVKLLRDIATGKRSEIGNEMPSQTGAQIVLLRLADPETVEGAVFRYQRSYGTRTSYHIAEELVWAEQPAIIPHLAGDFFLNDGDKSTLRSTGDPIGIMAPPRSAFSAFTSLKIVAASKHFSPEMREWAKTRRNAGIYPFTAFREEMRVWWKQNEAAFKVGDYIAVKPPVPDLPPSLPNPEDSKRVIPLPPTVKPAPAQETPPPPVIAPPVVANAERPIRESLRWWSWLVGIGAVIVLAALFLKRRAS